MTICGGKLLEGCEVAGEGRGNLNLLCNYLI